MTIRTFDEMNDVFGGMDDSFDELRRRLTAPWMGDADSRRQLIDTDEGYALVVDMPGFERDEIDVSVEDGMLTILATQETVDADLDDEETSLVRAAGRSRRAHERMRLPEGVTVDEITAAYRNGVLEIHLPTESERAVSGIDIPVRD